MNDLQIYIECECDYDMHRFEWATTDLLCRWKDAPIYYNVLLYDKMKYYYKYGLDRLPRKMPYQKLFVHNTEKNKRTVLLILNNERLTFGQEFYKKIMSQIKLERVYYVTLSEAVELLEILFKLYNKGLI